MKYAPMLAKEWHPDRINFGKGIIIQPKIDGVRSINRDGKLVSRQLKQHENKSTTEKFSLQLFHGFDGEMTLGDNPTGNDLCRLTSQALRTREGAPEMRWWLFDYVTENTLQLNYEDRIDTLRAHLSRNFDQMYKHFSIVESRLVTSMEELLILEDEYLNEGYEGIIVRDPYAKYKPGACGKTHMGAWRVKRFIDSEFLIEEIIEGKQNNNEATKDALGRTERSTHAENMQPNGMVGTLRGKLLQDVLDPQTGAVLMQAGLVIDVAPGEMDHAMRKYYFENQNELLGQIGKFKLFPKGTLDKPRFPQFLSIRNRNDL